VGIVRPFWSVNPAGRIVGLASVTSSCRQEPGKRHSLRHAKTRVHTQPTVARTQFGMSEHRAAAARAVTRGNDLSFRPGQPAYRRQSWAPAAERSGHVRGLCPWCCRAGGKSLPLTGPAHGVASHARWPGRLALAVARRAARAVCRRRGCAAAASKSSSPGGVPADLAGCAVGISRRPGTPARCHAAWAWRRPASAAGARTVSRLMPATGSGRHAIHGPAPGDRPAPPSRATGPWA
jgi:hypothetical protein